MKAKKPIKRANKIIDLLLKDVKKLGKHTVGDGFEVSQEIWVDDKGIMHLGLNFDFPIGVLKGVLKDD